MVELRQCVEHLHSDGRIDTMELEFSNATDWMQWMPQINDTIQIQDDGNASHVYHIHSIMPENGRYYMLATALPSYPADQQWGSLIDITLGELLDLAAAACNIPLFSYGVDRNAKYPYVLRQNEGWLSLALRWAQRENVCLWVQNSTLKAVDLDNAERFDAIVKLTLDADQPGIRYVLQPEQKYRSLTVQSGPIQVTASDSSAVRSNMKIMTLPAHNEACAGRWARAMLRQHNRKYEFLEIETELNPQFYALARVDIDGNTGMDGKWITDEADHDWTAKRSSVKLYRCSDTIR